MRGYSLNVSRLITCTRAFTRYSNKIKSLVQNEEQSSQVEPNIISHKSLKIHDEAIKKASSFDTFHFGFIGKFIGWIFFQIKVFLSCQPHLAEERQEQRVDIINQIKKAITSVDKNLMKKTKTDSLIQSRKAKAAQKKKFLIEFCTYINYRDKLKNENLPKALMSQEKIEFFEQFKTNLKQSMTSDDSSSLIKKLTLLGEALKEQQNADRHIQKEPKKMSPTEKITHLALTSTGNAAIAEFDNLLSPASPSFPPFSLEASNSLQTNLKQNSKDEVDSLEMESIGIILNEQFIKYTQIKNPKKDELINDPKQAFQNQLQKTLSKTFKGTHIHVTKENKLINIEFTGEDEKENKFTAQISFYDDTTFEKSLKKLRAC